MRTPSGRSPPSGRTASSLDIMMPGLDGYELCRRLRGMEHLAATKLIVMSTKAYPFDRKRAFDLGASGYFVKPLHPAAFVPEVERIVADTLVMTFWGVRGTLPVSRRDSVRYGGNTACVSLAFPDGRLLVLDAGTGIKALRRRARRRDSRARIERAHPDLAPALGPHQRAAVLRAVLRAGQPDRRLRPLARRRHHAGPPLGADGRRVLPDHHAGVRGQRELSRSRRRRLRPGWRPPADDACSCGTPGTCLGYRLDYGARSICYVTDNELYPPDHALHSDGVPRAARGLHARRRRARHRLHLHRRGVSGQDGLGPLVRDPGGRLRLARTRP